MKLKLAVIGYGNLGKSLEKEIEKNNGTELAAIYSRRYLDNPKYRPLNEIEKADDFDAALIALGSYGDVMNYAESLKISTPWTASILTPKFQNTKAISRR